MQDEPETGRGAAFKMNRDRARSPRIEGKRLPRFPGDFEMHSPRHTMHTRLGESQVDAVTILRIAGHTGLVV